MLPLNQNHLNTQRDSINICIKTTKSYLFYSAWHQFGNGNGNIPKYLQMKLTGTFKIIFMLIISAFLQRQTMWKHNWLGFAMLN